MNVAGFSDSLIITPNWSGVPSSNSIKKAKSGAEVVSLTGTMS